MCLLFHEHHFVLVIAKAGQVAIISPVKEFSPLVWTLAGKQLALIITVEVNLEGPVPDAESLQQFVLDVRLSRRRHEGWHPVFSRENAVDFSVWLYDARPADERR